MPIDEKALIRFGIAALMPGMRYMQEVIESHIGDYARLLDQLDPAADAPRRRGRPPKQQALLEAVALAAAPRRRGRPPKQQALPAPAVTAKKGHLSEAGREALSRAMKARWQKAKADQPATAKRSAVTAPAGRTGLISKKGTVITDPYWSRFTPEERKAEMARRVAKRKAAA